MDPVASPAPLSPQPKAFQPSNRLSFFFLVVLFLVSLSVSGYLLYQNRLLNAQLSQISSLDSQNSPSLAPSPTVSQAPNGDLADWKTYNNPAYKFSFKYPDASSVENNNYTGYLSTFIIRNISSDQNTDVTLYVGSTDESKNYTEAKAFDINGVEAKRVSLPQGQNPPQELVFFKNNSEYFHFQLVWDGKDKQALTTFDQILSTFKFTN